jgi:hypothetical protein
MSFTVGLASASARSVGASADPGAVEVLSHGRFKPGAVRTYELGTRAITVEAAAELGWLYGVPLAELLEP